ncbi:MAG: GFA family protein [Paracoccaceae bacterium]
MVDKTGQCMCGAVKFSLRDVQTDIGGCHCKMCQRWAGSALLAITVPDETIEISGTEHIATFQSSDWAERAWCSKCGSGLWYRVTAGGVHGGTRHMPVGLLDDTSGMKLTREIFVDVRNEAFSYAGDLKQKTGAEVMAEFAPSGEEN